MKYQQIKGFKGFRFDPEKEKLFCQPSFSGGKTFFELNIKKSVRGSISLCNNGFHFCSTLKKVFSFYPYINNRYEIYYAEIITDGKRDDSLEKSCAQSITLVKYVPNSLVFETLKYKMTESGKKRHNINKKYFLLYDNAYNFKFNTPDARKSFYDKIAAIKNPNKNSRITVDYAIYGKYALIF
ncbi:MAG: hypothetical protein ABIP51_11710 [Bacteroidia bacterium]